MSYPDPVVERLTHQAVAHLETVVDDGMGEAAGPLRGWFDDLFGEAGMASAFLARRAHPLVHLPLWAARAAGATLEGPVLADLTASSVSGYLFIRLVDNVVDRDGVGGEVELLPALGPLHHEFESPYHRLFPPGHPFWRLFREEWQATAQAAVLDARASIIDLEFFQAVSGRKTRAMVIPVGAVLHMAERPDLVSDWANLIWSFGCWQQLHNDLFDWLKDSHHHNLTLILSEGERRRWEEESVRTWFWREGFAWSRALLTSLEEGVIERADRLGSQGLDDYLGWRFADARARLDRVGQAMEEVSASLGPVRPAAGESPV